ncbi:MAG TPA: hypothetical protein DEA47_00910 [Peptococcaceae bacterium]|nr:hypothetical protein [Peptococcaceae bacterium]
MRGSYIIGSIGSGSFKQRPGFWGFSSQLILHGVCSSLCSCCPGYGAGEAAVEDSEGVLKGKAAPQFKLENLEGEMVSLSDFSGKTLVLTFWETWCPGCQKENPFINRLAEKYNGGDSIAVVTANLMEKDTPQTIRHYMESHGFDFPALLDRDGFKFLLPGYNITA